MFQHIHSTKKNSTDEEDQIIVAEIKNMLDISPTSEDESLTTLYPQN